MSFNINNLSNINIDGLTNNLYPHINLFKNLIENENYDSAQTLLKSNDELCQYMVLLYAAFNASSGESSSASNPFTAETDNTGYVNKFMMSDGEQQYDITISNGNFVINVHSDK